MEPYVKNYLSIRIIMILLGAFYIVTEFLKLYVRGSLSVGVNVGL